MGDVTVAVTCADVRPRHAGLGAGLAPAHAGLPVPGPGGLDLPRPGRARRDDGGARRGGGRSRSGPARRRDRAGHLGAVVGDQVGFFVGRRYGPRLVAPDARGLAAGPAPRLGAVVRTPARPDRGHLRPVDRQPAQPGAGHRRDERDAASARSPWRTSSADVIWATGVAVAGYLAGASYKVLESRLGIAANVLLAVVVGVAGLIWLRVASRRRHEAKPGEVDQDGDDDGTPARTQETEQC